MASVLDSFSEGFRLTSRHFGLLALPAFLVILAQGFIWYLEFLVENAFSLILFVPAVLVGFFAAAANVWLFSRALAIVTGSDHPFRWSAALALYGYLLIASAIVVVINVVFALLLPVSGVGIFGVFLLWQAILAFFYVRFFWFVAEVASDDREEGAFSRSWQLSSGHFFSIVGFSLLSSMIFLAGLVALGVGVFFALPMIVVSSVHYYESLRSE